MAYNIIGKLLVLLVIEVSRPLPFQLLTT